MLIVICYVTEKSILSIICGRRKWQPTPVFLPGESHGQRSLVGCCPQGRRESDTTEATQRACMHWKRKWQPTPVFLPGESCGQKSLVGCCPQGRRESDTTEATQQQQQYLQFLIFFFGTKATFFDIQCFCLCEPLYL